MLIFVKSMVLFIHRLFRKTPKMFIIGNHVRVQWSVSKFISEWELINLARIPERTNIYLQRINTCDLINWCNMQ